VTRILIDTCVLSELLRKKNADPVIRDEVRRLIDNDQAVIIGCIIQEILSGIRNQEQFDKIEYALGLFEDFPLQREDYCLAARYSNTCARHGVQGSSIDFLICAFSVRNNFPIFTTDKDFIHYSKQIPIELYSFPEK